MSNQKLEVTPKWVKESINLVHRYEISYREGDEVARNAAIDQVKGQQLFSFGTVTGTHPWSASHKYADIEKDLIP